MILLKANNFKSSFVNISKSNRGTVYIDNLNSRPIVTHTTRLPLLGLLSEDIIFLCSYKSWRLRLNVCFCFLVLAFLKGKHFHFVETYIDNYQTDLTDKIETHLQEFWNNTPHKFLYHHTLHNKYHILIIQLFEQEILLGHSD